VASAMPMLHSPPPMCFTLLSLIIILRSNAAPLTPPTATQYGIMIDAGSGGSRAHLFEWKTRRVSELPPPLSYPVTNVAWTEKVKPGLSAYWQYPKSVKTVLNVLLEWVKSRLAHVKQWWGYYPIYLKATAGLRELPAEPRKKLIAVIRDFFLNNSTCPFYFEEFDAARVISGEEEAAYAWTAINYATGALLKYSWGSGTASPLNAYGSLELGGASAQIAFYDSNEDILANLFKVQVGQQRHWNIYAHSFLHYGQNSARRRMWGKLAEDVGCYKEKEFKKLQENGKACSIRDYCLPKGYVYPPYLVPASSDGEAGVPPPFGYSPVVELLIRSVASTTTTTSSSSSSTINAATTAGATATGTATTTTTGTTVSTTQQPSPRPSSSSTRGTRRRSSTLSSSRTTTIPSTGCSQDQQDQPKSLLTSVYSTSKRERGEIKNTSSARRVSSPRIHVKGYNVGRTIGEGAFGKVKFARRVSGGQGLVIKIMEKKGIDDLKRVNQIFGEMFILTSLRHKNVIQLYDVVNQYNNIILVMEYAEGGELSKLIEKHLYLSESHASRLFSQILDGLVYCHRLKVIHRDLKLENILLDSEGNIKIVDFGLSERLLGDAKLESVCGTPLYMSPELMRGQKYDGSTDVWSLGVVLYAMVCGFLPFAAKNLQNLSQKVCNGFFTIPSFLSKGLTDLIRSMLEVKSLDRLPLESIQNHSWAMMTEYLGGGGEENDTKRKMTFSEVAKLKEECHRDADTKLAKMRVSKLRPQQQQQQQQQQHVRGRSDTTNYSSNQRAAAAAAGLATPRINTSPHARLHPHVQDVGAIAGGGGRLTCKACQ